jgi:hypothetical protein
MDDLCRSYREWQGRADSGRWTEYAGRLYHDLTASSCSGIWNMANPQSTARIRPAATRFATFIANHEPSDGVLPFVHTTRAYSFDEMLGTEGLEPTECAIFREKLIYLFYGRPAYRAKDGRNARLQFEWPIIFVLDPHKIEPIVRVYPFDTGAFESKMYKEFFDQRAEMNDFALEPTLETVKKLVATFYQNHDEYYTGYSHKNVDLPNRQFEAEGVLELARLPGVQGNPSFAATRDERSSAIEVQVNHPIRFSEALSAIVLPRPYLDDPDIQDALRRWGDPPIVRTYPTLHNMGPEAWVGQIYHIVQEIYEDLGYLTKGT